MPVSTDEVINEIKVRMRGAEKEWPSAARTLTGQVGHYLSDRQGMTTELGQLEAEMHHLANQRLNGAKLDVQAAQSDFHSRASGEKIATHLQGLLTTVLSQVEFANNFVLGVRAPNKPVRAVTLTGLVPADEFRQIIEKRQPFKDPTVSYGHGEFSHRIQWYCVMKQTGFGKGTSWTDFYSWVGTQKHDEPKTADGPPAWDSLRMVPGNFGDGVYYQRPRLLFGVHQIDGRISQKSLVHGDYALEGMGTCSWRWPPNGRPHSRVGAPQRTRLQTNLYLSDR